MKKLLPLLLLVAFLPLAATQTTLDEKMRSQFYQAYLTNSLLLWKNGLQELEAAYQSSEDPEILLAMARAEVGAVGACFAQQDFDQAANWLERAEKHVKTLLKTNPDLPEAHALIAGIYGQKIALKPIRGMFLGGKSNKHLQRAIELGPENPLAHFQRGNNYYHTPAAFGGDLDKAVEHLQAARRLYEQCNMAENWEYLNTLAWLGQALAKQGNPQAARSVYERALQVEPEFGWVKKVLLPALQERAGSR